MRISILLYLVVVTLVLSVPMDMRPTFSTEVDLGFSEPVRGGNIDVFTQKGGKGPSNPSPPFRLGAEVLLYANVTYSQWPEQNKDVAFQILAPFERSFLLFGRTNASGIAEASFQLPPAECADVFGAWTVIVSVDIAETVVDDTLEFNVWWNLADVNQDWKVDLYDAVLMSQAYGSTFADANWNPHCDIANPYGIIDLLDTALVVTNYGQKYTP
jgi:hypothetical protein